MAIAFVVCGEMGWGLLATVVSSLSVALFTWLSRWHQATGRWGTTASVLAWFGVIVAHTQQRPLLVLVLGLGTISLLFALWRRVPPDSPVSPRGVGGATAGAPCGAAALTCIVASLVTGAWSAMAAACAAVALALAAGPWIRRAGAGVPGAWRARVVTVGLFAAIAGAALVGFDRAPPGLLTLSALIPLSALFVQEGLATESGGSLADLVLEHPARLLVATFVGLCIAGTIGLSLPASAAGSHSIGVMNAAFTSVSAACVTGLIVVDTPTAFTLFGQIVVLLLIQAGGLGIMTISTSALSLLGRRLSLKQEAVMAALVSQENRADLYGALKRTVAVTTAFELVGSLFLAFAFLREGDGWATAAWRGLFTSVSAFCNAGFALQSDSLVPYQSNPLVLHVVGVLIVAGGLSPVALVALPKLLRRERLVLQVRIAFVSTVALVVVGFALLAALEWSASLGPLGWLDRLHNAWFQSITLRTAGFNSVDFAALRPATWIVMIVWMFIGGCPGGTAGGLKTTTVFVLLLAVAGSLRGKTEADAYGRSIPMRTVFKATAAATMGIASVVGALTVLLIAQSLPFHVALFEVVSALGTVGLTLGGTAELDEVGKTVIMVCMFLGRVGPLTVFLILSDRRAPPTRTLPEEEVEVG